MSRSPLARLSTSAFLRGKTVYCRGNEKPVSAFLGIPYAEAPVGNRRFAPPAEKALWTGERDATEFGPICPQNKKVLRDQIYPYPVPDMSEDCLYLNVWTPTLNQNAKLPVMLWIHGGAFVNGLSNVYDGTAFAALEDVVFISINYRLAALGFMSTGDIHSPGNYGILDQIASLRWTKKFISNFGGDPDNVTVFGESAGGISVSGLLLCDLAGGLFRRAISQSGVMCYPGDVWTGEQARKFITKRATKMGYTGNSSKELVSFLRNAAVEDLEQFDTGFCAVIDGYVIQDHPKNLYQKDMFQNKEYMLGFNSHEGASFVFNILRKTSCANLTEAKNFINTLVKVNYFRGHQNKEHISASLVNEYLGNIKDGDEEAITQALVEFYGDILFLAPTVHVAALHGEKAKTFLYLFAKRPPFSRWPSWVIADHSHEIMYALGWPFLERFPDVFSEEDRKLSMTVMKYWANFARTGDPNCSSLPIWPEHRPSDSCQHLVIADTISIQSNFNQSRMEFWNKTLSNMTKISSKY